MNNYNNNNNVNIPQFNNFDVNYQKPNNSCYNNIYNNINSNYQLSNNNNYNNNSNFNFNSLTLSETQREEKSDKTPTESLSINSDFNYLDSKKIWTKEEDQILINFVKSTNTHNWKKVAAILKNKTPQQCSYRFNKIYTQKDLQKWTRNEDILIVELIEKFGLDWDKIKTYFPNRKKEEISERYFKKLDPSLKRCKFEPEEDALIIKLHNIHGNKWNEISRYFKDRSSGMIKNRYYSFLKKRLEKDDNNLSNNNDNINNNYSNSGNYSEFNNSSSYFTSGKNNNTNNSSVNMNLNNNEYLNISLSGTGNTNINIYNNNTSISQNLNMNIADDDINNYYNFNKTYLPENDKLKRELSADPKRGTSNKFYSVNYDGMNNINNMNNINTLSEGENNLYNLPDAVNASNIPMLSSAPKLHNYPFYDYRGYLVQSSADPNQHLIGKSIRDFNVNNNEKQAKSVDSNSYSSEKTGLNIHFQNINLKNNNDLKNTTPSIDNDNSNNISLNMNTANKTTMQEDSFWDFNSNLDMELDFEDFLQDFERIEKFSGDFTYDNGARAQGKLNSIADANDNDNCTHNKNNFYSVYDVYDYNNTSLLDLLDEDKFDKNHFNSLSSQNNSGKNSFDSIYNNYHNSADSDHNSSNNLKRFNNFLFNNPNVNLSSNNDNNNLINESINKNKAYIDNTSYEINNKNFNQNIFDQNNYYKNYTSNSNVNNQSFNPHAIQNEQSNNINVKMVSSKNVPNYSSNSTINNNNVTANIENEGGLLRKKYYYEDFGNIKNLNINSFTNNLNSNNSYMNNPPAPGQIISESSLLSQNNFNNVNSSANNFNNNNTHVINNNSYNNNTVNRLINLKKDSTNSNLSAGNNLQRNADSKMLLDDVEVTNLPRDFLKIDAYSPKNKEDSKKKNSFRENYNKYFTNAEELYNINNNPHLISLNSPYNPKYPALSENYIDTQKFTNIPENSQTYSQILLENEKENHNTNNNPLNNNNQSSNQTGLNPIPAHVNMNTEYSSKHYDQDSKLIQQYNLLESVFNKYNQFKNCKIKLKSRHTTSNGELKLSKVQAKILKADKELDERRDSLTKKLTQIKNDYLIELNNNSKFEKDHNFLRKSLMLQIEILMKLINTTKIKIDLIRKYESEVKTRNHNKTSKQKTQKYNINDS